MKTKKIFAVIMAVLVCVSMLLSFVTLVFMLSYDTVEYFIQTVGLWVASAILLKAYDRNGFDVVSLWY